MKVSVYHYSQHLHDLELPTIDLENGGEFYIGRADDCHVQLDDHQISRQHALFYYENKKLKIKKLTEFGTIQVAGNEVSDIELSEGAQVVIADFKLIVSQIPLGNEVVDKVDESIPSMPVAEPQELTRDNIESKSDEFGDATEKMQNEFEDTLDQSLEATDTIDSEGLANDSNDDLSDLDDNNSLNDNFGSDEAQADLNSDGFNEDEAADSAFGEESSEDNGFGEDSDSGFGDDGGFGDDDGGFGDDGFGGGGDVGESTQVFQSFAKYALTLDGQFAPFDRYTIEDKEIFIGRDAEKCQIVLNDSEVSSVHAVIKKTLINCFIEDLDSSNGTIVNGSRVNKAELSNGDNFQIGSTYFTLKVDSDLIEQESDMLMPVEDDQEIEVEEIIEEEVDYGELDGDGEFAGDFGGDEAPVGGLKGIFKDPKKKRIFMIVAVLLIGVLLLDDESTTDTKPVVKKPKKAKVQDAPKSKKYSPEVLEQLEANYQLALAKYGTGDYADAMTYINIVKGIDPKYNEIESIEQLVKDGFKQLEEKKRQEEEEKKRQILLAEVKELVKKAREAVDKRQVELAESLFGQIVQKDPENLEVPQMRIEIEAYQKAKEKKRLDEERKKALRQSMVDALAPGKALYLKEDWYVAIDKLQKFVKKDGMDEDLIKEATEMIKDSKRKLSSIISPLLAKARSAREGQDLKRAYETYGEVLKFDPSNGEALLAREEIFDTLTNRSRKIYREALISESLSLFDEAKEKFQEVQQISPINSEYYNKASSKLKNYLE